MISIIVSSYKEDVFKRFYENVGYTIGNIRYEIIKIYNPGMMGISQAYNEGAGKAKYPYLVFSHDDVLFHTENWGSIIQEIFEQEPDVGLIGCAGGLYKSYLPVGWNVDPKYTSLYMIGTHYGSSHLTKTYKGTSRSLKLNAKNNIPKDFRESEVINEEVLMLDGMFMSTKKSIHEKIPFDQDTFKGFHSYDLDYSLQLNRTYKVIVNHNILVEHFSPGRFDLAWLEEINKLNRKWRNSLPLSLNHISNVQRRELEFKCFESIVRINKHIDLPSTNALNYIFNKFYISKLGRMNWILLIFKVLKKFTVKLVNSF